MRRPLGFTILALGLGWLTIGALILAASASLIVTRPLHRAAFVACALGYGIAAAGTARALWGMRASTMQWLLAWGFFTALSGWMPHLVPNNQAPIWTGFGAILLAAVVILPVAMYVASRLRRPPPDAP